MSDLEAEGTASLYITPTPKTDRETGSSEKNSAFQSQGTATGGDKGPSQFNCSQLLMSRSP